MKIGEVLEELEELQREVGSTANLSLERAATGISVLRCPKSFRTDDFADIEVDLE